MIVGRYESANEIIAWFQSRSCQNQLLYDVVQVLLELKRPQEATPYAERISGLTRVRALNLFVNNKWVEGDKLGAIKLVEDTEAVAVQLLSSASDVLAMSVHNQMAFAWCRVGNVAKAIQSLERINPDTLVRHWDRNDTWEGFSLFEHVFGIVVGILLSSGNDNEAQLVLGSFRSKVERSDSQAGEKYQKMVTDAFNGKKNMLPENLQDEIDRELRIYDYQMKGTVEPYYELLSSGSVKLARENQFTEPNLWISFAGEYSFFYNSVYYEGAEFLANTANYDALRSVHILSRNSAYLFLGSRSIKDFAAAWRE